MMVLSRHLAATCCLASCLFAHSTVRAQVTFLNSISPLSGPTDVTVSFSGDVYVADFNSARVRVFDAKGSQESSIATTSPRGVAVGPTGLADPTDFVYVVDRDNNRIRKYNSNGSFLLQFGSAGSGNGQFNEPLSAAVNIAGELFVADSLNNRIQRFNPNLMPFNAAAAFQSTFGASGSEPGQFNAPTGVTVDPSGNIYVADRSNNRIQKFDSNGGFELAFGILGTGTGQFNNPSGITFSPSGHLYVADRDNNRIQRFDSEGVFQEQFGTLGSQNEQFNSPRGVGVSQSGLVYVADTNNNRVTRYFDADAWVSGRNEFTATASEPTSVGVGAPFIFEGERRVLLGPVFTLDGLKELVVGDTTTIASNGVLLLAGGTLITNILEGDGELRFEGGTLQVGNAGIRLGDTSPLDDRLNVGGRSRVSTTGALVIGAARASQLRVVEGGTVASVGGTIAGAASTLGIVRVEGFDSTWSNTGNLVVGDRGSGRLEITGGGRVTDLAANVGSANGGDGAVVVSGFGSEWSHSGNLSIGVAGSGFLTIERGAIVRNTSGFIASPTGDAAVRVDGTGSTWINAQSLAIGDGGELIVTDGGVVQVGQNISIGTGALADVQGTLRATGSAANAGEIRLGGGASRIEATQLANQGHVSGGGLIAAPLENAAGGQVDVGAGERLTLSGMANVNRGEVNLAGGEIALDDSLLNDQTGLVAGRGTIRAAGGITNQATMTFSGGQTDLHADVVNTGASALILTTGGGTTTFFGTASNQSGGEIRVSRGSNVVFLSTFNGGTTGEGTAVIEGVLAPGNSPAAVNFAGQLIVASQATVEMELGGTMPGTEHDAITVGNALELDGTLNLLPIGGYSDPPRGQADRFALFSAQGGRSGAFATVDYDGVRLQPTFSDQDSFRSHQGAGLFRIVDYTNGGVDFINYLALAGDTDGNLAVEFADFVTLADNFSQPGTWLEGDFDQDGLVQFPDFTALANNFSATVPAPAISAVPEPSSYLLAALYLSAFVGLARRRLSATTRRAH